MGLYYESQCLQVDMENGTRVDGNPIKENGHEQIAFIKHQMYMYRGMVCMFAWKRRFPFLYYKKR